MPSQSFRSLGTRLRISASVSAPDSKRRDGDDMNVQTDKTSLSAASSVDIKRILQMIPHLYPMLMVDRGVGMELDHRAIGIKNVTINEPVFQVHIPSSPLL